MRQSGKVDHFVWLLNSGVRVATIGAKDRERQALKDEGVGSFPVIAATTGPAPATLETSNSRAEMKSIPVPNEKKEGTKSDLPNAITTKDGTVINIKERSVHQATALALAVMSGEVDADSASSGSSASSVTSTDKQKDVAAVPNSITTKDGTVISIKERRSSNVSGALALAAAEAEKAKTKNKNIEVTSITNKDGTHNPTTTDYSSLVV